jgi:hypothetical protein
LKPVFFIITVLSGWLGMSRGWGADYAKDWARMKFIVPQGYVCYHTTGPLTIDGRLDEADWQHAAWTRDFQDIEGDAKPAPRFRTRAKMLWDDDYFYVGAELEEPHVWATLTNHDAIIFQDNDFEVFIDPDGDRHEYYEIEINALNTEWDLLLKKPYISGGPGPQESGSYTRLAQQSVRHGPRMVGGTCVSMEGTARVCTSSSPAARR